MHVCKQVCCLKSLLPSYPNMVFHFKNPWSPACSNTSAQFWTFWITPPPLIVPLCTVLLHRKSHNKRKMTAYVQTYLKNTYAPNDTTKQQRMAVEMFRTMRAEWQNLCLHLLPENRDVYKQMLSNHTNSVMNTQMKYSCMCFISRPVQSCVSQKHCWATTAVTGNVPNNSLSVTC